MLSARRQMLLTVSAALFFTLMLLVFGLGVEYGRGRANVDAMGAILDIGGGSYE